MSLKLPTLCLGLFLSLQASAITYVACDFQNGIPEDFATIDRDGHDLHFTMTQLGFAAQDAWTTLREEGTENIYAASASRFKVSNGESVPPADGWLVTPPIWIRAGDAVLSWRGMTVNDRSSRTSSYEVMVSVSGTDPGDFVSLPGGHVEGEEVYRWTSHEIPLGQYAGQRVHIAFVNTSVDSDVLAIDDINVSGGSGLAELKVLPEEYTFGAEEIVFGGVLTATSDEIVDNLSVAFSVDGETFEAEYSGLGLAMGDRFEFTLPERVAARYGDTIDFSVAYSVNGVPFDTQSLHTTLLVFLPEKRIVVEEATGMWCGYCPEGTVAMATLEERHPDRFIGVAVHVDDDMQVDGYGDVMSFPGGAPTAWIDRKTYVKEMLTTVFADGIHTYTTLMGGIETMFLSRLEEQVFADIEVDGSLDAGPGELRADVSLRFAKGYDDADFRLILLLTEDHVWKKGYYQTNYHSGRDESLGGFEALPPMIVQDYEFNHVARAALTGHKGMGGILPAKVEPGEEYTFSSSYELPDSILDPGNVSLVAMVADGATGEVVNAAVWRPAPAGVGSVPGDNLSLAVDGHSLTVVGDGRIEVCAFDVSGVCLGRRVADGSATLRGLPSGVVLLDARSPRSTRTFKVLLP